MNIRYVILTLILVPASSYGFFFYAEPVSDSDITPADITASGTISGDGSGITNIDPAQIASGIIGSGVQVSAIQCNAGELLEGGGNGCQPIGAGGHGNGANCSAGNSPLGVDASGAVEGCFDVATQAELDALPTIQVKTSAELQSEACASYATTPCTRYNSDDDDLYTSTGSAVGQWRNARTGLGPQ